MLSVVLLSYLLSLQVINNIYILYLISEKMTNPSDLDTYYEAVLTLTKSAGEVKILKNSETLSGYLNKIFQLIREKSSNRNKSVEIKSSDIDLVTETDQQVEKLLIDGLSKQFPDHKFIGEESVSGGAKCNLTDAPTWIIDPIDGTMNFVHNFPHSCVSIALFVNQIPEIGIVYNPSLSQLFTARKGKGAFLNGKPITVSGKTELSESLIMLEFGTSRDPEKSKIVLENQKILMPKVHG